MAGFKFSINVEPQDIPRLDNAHKRDCADALSASVNSTLKYTLIMAGTILALFSAYSYFSFIWMMRMHYMLPSVSGVVPLTAGAIIIFEFISGTMKGWALALQTFFHVVLIFAAFTSIPSLVTVPFAIYGAILHFKLITLLPWHKVISSQPGYPEFTSLPDKKEVAAQKPEDKKESAAEKQSDPQSDSEEPAPEPEKAVTEENKPEVSQPVAAEDRSEDNRPMDTEKQETTAGKSSGGNSKKKHKRKKGRK